MMSSIMQYYIMGYSQEKDRTRTVRSNPSVQLCMFLQRAIAHGEIDEKPVDLGFT